MVQGFVSRTVLLVVTSSIMLVSRPGGREAFGRHAKKPADMQEWLSEMEKICGRCLRLAVRDAKTLRPMFAVGCPRCKKLCGRCLRLAARDAKNSAADVCGWLSEMQKNSAANVCGWPQMQKTLRPMFAVGCPRCKKLCGRCLRLASDAKNSAADVCGWLSEMQKLRTLLPMLPEMKKAQWPMFAVGCLRCKDVCGLCLRLAA